MSLFSLFHTSYWFATPTAISSLALTILIVFFSLLLILGIVCKSVSHQETIERFTAKVLRRWGSLCLVMAVLGFFYVFLRYEFVPLFSYRLWLGVWVLIAAYWAFQIYRYQTKKVPELRERYQKDARKYAYLPRTQQR